MLKKRRDGRLIATIDPFMKIVPYIMETRAGSLNQMQVEVNIAEALKLVREHRSISLFHVVVAAVVRTISQRPAINRFVAGRRIYARNSIDIAFAVKKELTDSGQETVVKVSFSPTDTVFTVSEKIIAAVENAKTGAEKDDDALARIVTSTPRAVIRLFFHIIKFLEYHNALPSFIIKLDPFHSSIFISNLGSLGISSVNHHLYEWGTTSLFLAMGGVEWAAVAEADGKIQSIKVLPLCISCDDRICDGLYYSRSVRLLQKLLKNPSVLKTPPKTVEMDVN